MAYQLPKPVLKLVPKLAFTGEMQKRPGKIQGPIKKPHADTCAIPQSKLRVQFAHNAPG